MITLFYKILYKKERVVYVGVTTRSLVQRFNEHVKKKELNEIDYSIEEIDRIDHGNISTLDDLRRERVKVFELENYYINKYKSKFLLNISDGGEWGVNLYKKLLKEDFINKYGNLDNYEEYVRKRHVVLVWIRSWIKSSISNKTESWIYNWISTKSINKTEVWIKGWIVNKSVNKTKLFIHNWILHTNENKVKSWLKMWIKHTSADITKSWLQEWICNKSANSTKKWLKEWVDTRSSNATKIWLRNWVTNQSKNRTKSWMNCWIRHKS